MASIYDLLAGNVQTEQDYLAQDPYYASGRSILGIQARPTNSTEAWLGPILQGLAGGGLMGVGKQNAAQSAFSDAQSSPFLAPLLANEREASTFPDYSPNSYLAPYLSGEMPENFTPKQARADQIMALLMASNDQESAIEKLKQQGEIQKALLPYSQLAIEAKRAEQGLGDVKKDISTVANKEQSMSFIDEKYNQAKELNGTAGALISELGIPTYKGNALTALGDSVVVQVDKMIGRELNSDVRKRMLTLAPKSYDTDAEIERKKADMKELVSSLAAATPALSSMTATAPASLELKQQMAPPPPLPGETKEAYKARLKGS